ncbi:MAG TPA: alginate export family protein [Candidatus Hydrogenedentes bacterium]|nr:alginate export family protein [Candidatus Hydrogenedentota bacterium]HQM50708.1 alginate export family protein [Candidatus Hydrogenedentota bacterium]
MYSRHKRRVLCLLLVLACTGSALAELQNVQVGGEIRIRGNFITNGLVRTTFMGIPEVRWPASLLTGRPIGGPGAAGGFNGLGIVSPVKWSDTDGGDVGFVEQRTRLNINADFTDDVSAFIEFDSYDIWGQDFRSLNYITGADSPGWTGDDVEVYQSYIEAENMFDLPLRLRVGRQELSFGSEWLVGPKDYVYFFYGRSFDGARLTYKTDTFSVDAFAAELAEGGPFEEDEDVWFYGLYASCTAIENHTFDLYWLWLRDARRVADTNLAWFGEWVEDLFNIDDYDPTNLHTVGFRASGLIGALDYEVEAAYQFGDAGQVGTTFKPFVYGDDDAEFDTWGGHFDVGYTFDVAWKPRPFIGGAYFGGEDNRDISFWEWLNPFDQPEASVSFNRLFSNSMYCGAIDAFNDLSNCWLGRAGVVVHPTPAFDVILAATYFEAIEPFDAPVHFKVGRYRIPIAPALSFWTQENSDEIGWDTSIFVVYHYSEDVTCTFQYSRFWVGDGVADGAFIYNNGLIFSGGRDDKDADFLAAEMRIKF